MLLLGIAALILLSLSPVVGRHLLGAANQPLTGIDHIGALCLVALHLLLNPLHTGLHWAVGAGAVYAIWDRVRAVRRANGVLRQLESAPVTHGDAFWTAAKRASLPLERLRVISGLPIPAFTLGWLRPVVYVSRGLGHGPRALPVDELVAVLSHERAHLRRYDPLRFSALRAMACMLFWIPALRKMADDVADEAEIRADDAAASMVDPLVLASAIVSLASWRTPEPDASGDLKSDYAVGFVRRDLIERRVKRLAGEDTLPASRLTRRSLWGAALALVVVWTSGIVHVHALPHADDAHIQGSAHCAHPDGSPFSHLFCRRGAVGGWITPGGSDCPHQVSSAITPGL